jgi:hypothetical protein
MIKAGAVLFATATILTVAVASPATARDFPYCLQGRMWGYPGNCQFDTYQQCAATASGTDASCGVNPVVAFQQQQRPVLEPVPPVGRRYRY